MRFPVYFKRQKGSVSTDPVLGSDSAPTVSSGPQKNKPHILSHKMTRPMKRVDVGYWYEGAGTAVTLSVALWVFDENSLKWYLASTGTLTNGQITYLRCPFLADPPPTSVNLNNPSHGTDVMIIVSDNSGPDGVYHFVAGPDSVEF